MRETQTHASRPATMRARGRVSALAFAAMAGILLASCGGTPPSGTPNTGSIAQVEPSTRRGDLVLRANAVATVSLNAAVARQYGIAIDAKTVMLLVSVRRGLDDREASVPAKVEASAVTLLGSRQPIVMHEIRSGEFVDYVGTTEAIMPDTLRFDVSAVAQSGERMELQFNRDFFPQ